MLYAIIGMLVIIADQYIKFWVQGHIALTSTGEEFIPGILSLVNVHNDGAAFGFLAGSGARIPFIIVAGVFTVAVIIALATKLISGKLARWSIVLVTAGALSNCLDRVLYGYVQDMFKTEFMNFPVFNLADVFITLFAIVFALAVIFGKTRRDDDDDYEFEDDEDDEEYEKPKRSSRRKEKRSRRRASRYEDEDDYEEDEEDDEEYEKPSRAARKSLKSRRAKRAAVEEDEEDDYEEPAPAPARRQTAGTQKTAAPKARASAAKTVQSDEDPFAGWDRAEAKVEAAKKTAAAAAPAARAAARSTAPAQSAQARPAQRRAQPAAAKPAAAKPAARPAAQTTAKPAAVPAAKPAAKPAPRPAAKPAPAAEEEFSLDDILNEFR